MLKFIVLITLLTGLEATAHEIPYFRCTSQTKDFATVVANQVVTYNASSYTATFKIAVTDASGVATEYWQEGYINIGSDNSLIGLFKDGTHLIHATLMAPTYPYFEPRDSTLTSESGVVHLNCENSNPRP